MDQIKTGRFIAALRREKGLTQFQLADKLAISDKTVSKWERGAGMPDVSLMLPLCEALAISVNELLTGERLSGSEYREKAEANIMDLVRENRENKKKMAQSVTCGVITIIAVCALIVIAAYVELPVLARILFIVLALATAVAGIATAASLERTAGCFECPECGSFFVPTAAEYVKGVHTFTKRRLTCPECGRTSMCRHRVVR